MKKPKNVLEMALTSFTYMFIEKLSRDIEHYKDKVDLRIIPTLCR
jgi:hypothetical protein